MGKPKIRDRYFNYFVIEHNHSVFFMKRIDSDIWKNLYDFPLMETSHPLVPQKLDFPESLHRYFTNEKVTIMHISDEITHLLSHQRIHARFYHILSNSIENFPPKFILINKKDIFDLPVPKIIETYLLEMNFIN